MKMLSVKNYYRDHGVRDMCHGMQDGDNTAIAHIARLMAQQLNALPLGGILIPIPSHTGHATATLLLARKLARLSGRRMVDCIEGQAREPLYSLKLKKRKVPVGFFAFRLTCAMPVCTPILIDSVYDTGQTAHAAAKLFTNRPSMIFTFARVVR